MKRATISRLVAVFLVVFLTSGYAAFFAAVRITLRHRRSHSFGSLPPPHAQELRTLVQTFYDFETSRIETQYTNDSLQQNISYLQNLRTQASHDAWPIIDLRMATDYAVIARLDQSSNNFGEAAAHRQRAENIFRSLGWKDVSASILSKVADKQLQSRARE